MRKTFESELDALHEGYIQMSMNVIEAIHMAVKAFVNHDKELAKQVIENDPLINQKESQLEKRSIELIALQQPVSSDLRKIITVMKASADLERMGDHAVSIAKSTIRVKGNKRTFSIEEDIANLSEIVTNRVESVAEAFIQYDEEKAKKIASKDKEIDDLAYSIYHSSIEEMKQDNEIVLGATDYILVSGYLERIGDYVTNICEWIVFLRTGEIVELNTHNYIDRK
ncbi:phosphate signaling complex protein PhoU [Lacticigenium naphthae]|uniref:phosphate signaling complex protein PhoU n=1 Tax=Lacticigenium naphthae TaxID=515351 RepID=UPI0003FA39A6|nr:phosphate signaling complex protein PhoU [Lacticigenium naphthae]